MFEILKIAEVMGGRGTLGSRVTSMHDLTDTISAGLPKQALRKTAQRIFHHPREVNKLIYRLVPEATYKRRTRLTPAESERTERLARVIAAAEEAWSDQKDAHQWLQTAHPELGGSTPLERSLSELGAREVEELLNKMYYGIPA